MGNSKITYFGQTLIDLTNDTVDEDHLASGVTAHDKAGNSIVGTMEAGAVSKTMTFSNSSASTSMSITGFAAEPKSFSVTLASDVTSSSTRYVINVAGGAGVTMVTYAYKSGNNSYIYQSTSYCTTTYNNGTLTLRTTSSTNGGTFYKGTYRVIYSY